MPREVPWRALGGLTAGALVGLLVVGLVLRGKPLPDGPAAVAWDRQPCAHCRMLVGEPPHAAQLVTREGDVAFFDDPGCLFHYVDEHRPEIHRLWFHDSTGERWLAADEVGFVAGAQTPMGFGLAAVPRATGGAADLETARRRVLEQHP